MTTYVVTLNCTDYNPWRKYHLTQNPFPQLGKLEYVDAERRVASLGGDPLTGPDDIRTRLGKGFDPEFVELCCRMFKPGRIVRFKVFWP